MQILILAKYFQELSFRINIYNFAAVVKSRQSLRCKYVFALHLTNKSPQHRTGLYKIVGQLLEQQKVAKIVLTFLVRMRLLLRFLWASWHSLILSVKARLVLFQCTLMSLAALLIRLFTSYLICLVPARPAA